jgi:hypothetical protein
VPKISCNPKLFTIRSYADCLFRPVLHRGRHVNQKSVQQDDTAQTEVSQNPVQLVASELGFASDIDFLRQTAREKNVCEAAAEPYIALYQQSGSMPYFSRPTINQFLATQRRNDEARRAAAILSSSEPEPVQKLAKSSPAALHEEKERKRVLKMKKRRRGCGNRSSRR